MKKRKAEVGFQEWLMLECKYGDLMLPMVTVCALLFASLVLALSFIECMPLFVGLGAAFGLALRWRWKRELEDPPWYLDEREREERKRWQS